MKVRCINASNKPKQIPEHEWVKEGEVYTVVRVVRLSLQKDRMGLILKEIKLTDSFPYEFYDSNRFEPLKEVTAEEEVAEEADFDLV